MLRVDFMFADSTTDFILVIYNDSSLLIGVMTIALRKKRYDEAVVICVKLGLDMPALPKQRKRRLPVWGTFTYQRTRPMSTHGRLLNNITSTIFRSHQSVGYKDRK